MAKVNDSDPISIKEAEEALRRSGYLLEDRIDTLLRGKGYHTAPNSTYPDPITGESRELDLLADHWRFDEQGDARRAVDHILVIECMNNPQPIAFITKKHKTSGMVSVLKVFPGWLTTVPQDPETGRYEGKAMTEALELARYHHYAKGRVATQYCTFQRKAQGDRQWMALHHDRDHGTFRKLCDAVDNYSPNLDIGTRSLFFVYPILVVQGGLLEVQQDGDRLKVKEVDHIAYTHAIYRGERDGQKQVRYRIDVVTESFLPKLLDMMEKSREEVLRRLWELPDHDSTDSTVEIAVETPEGVKSL